MQDIQHEERRSFLVYTGHIAKGTYKTWFTYWWWFIALRLIISYINPYTLSDLIGTPFLAIGFSYIYLKTFNNTLLVLFSCIYTVPMFISLYLSAKPDQDRKSFSYFMHYLPHMVILMLWFCALVALYYVFWFCIVGIAYVISVGSPKMHMVLEVGVAIVFAVAKCCMAIVSLFFITALFEFRQINLWRIYRRTQETILKNETILIAGSILWLIWEAMSNYLVNSMIHTVPYHTIFFGVICFDMLIELPLLIIIATSIYYRTRHE